MTVINSVDTGTINADNNGVLCKGETVRMNGHVVDEIVKTSQYQVIVKRVKYLIQDTFMGVVDEQIKLPQNCPVHRGGCQLATHTVIWDPPTEGCPYEMI